MVAWPAAAEMRTRRLEAYGLLALALLTAVVFANGALDLAVARWFYEPAGTERWPLARHFPWPLLYRAATWITAGLVVLGLAALGAGFAARRRRWRDYAVLLLLSVALGPGLLGNAVLKDHWRHPRPRDLVEFGGTQHYVPSPLIGGETGASFPCGHCSVGFLYGIGWWVWRHRRPQLAAASLALGLLLGLLLGVGRMAAGAHFLSDVIWSALLAFTVTHLLYYVVLRLGGGAPVAASRGGRRRSRQAVHLAAALAGAAVLFALLAAPHGSTLATRVPLAAGSPRLFDLEADRANITLVLTDSPPDELVIEGELHGFGLPGSRLGARLETLAAPAPTLRYRIEARGWLTDVDAAARVRFPAAAFERVSVRVQRGDIRVIDGTRAGAVRAHRVELDLQAAHGNVQLP